MISRRFFTLGGVSVAGLAVAGCAAKPKAARNPTAGASLGLVTAKGAFVGDSGHATSGEVSVSRKDGEWMVNLGADFSLDNGPDPKVALGRDGFRKESLLAPLRSLKGAQSYAVPASLDVADYNQVFIWCEEFAVPLGHADLTLV